MMNRRTFLKGVAALPFVAFPTLASGKLWSVVSDTYDIVYIFGPYTRYVKPEYRNKVVFVRNGRNKLFPDKFAGPMAAKYEATHILDLKRKHAMKSRDGLNFDETLKVNFHRDMVFVNSTRDMVSGVRIIKPSEFRLDMISTV